MSCAAVPPAAQPFFAALLRKLFPQRPLVVVTDGLKTQESFHQDLATWCTVQSSKFEVQGSPAAQLSTLNSQPLFFPAWEILPHESKLPHADVISERLETLVALSAPSPLASRLSPVVVTTVTALLQKTFPAATIAARTRTLRRGDQLDPLDLIEWLEEQGYEPEAQVTHKGEIALRGGILDLFPLTSPWPVRLEFFGNELESLRQFDPVTQISKEEITEITIPPGGELGILKQSAQSSVLSSQSRGGTVAASGTGTEHWALSTENSTLERFITASLILGLAAEKQGDLFGLITFSDQVGTFIRARSGPAHYHACRDALHTLEARTVTPDFEELASFIRLRLRRRALLLFLTSLDDPALAESFTRGMDLIARQHLVLVNMIQPAGARPLFTDDGVENEDALYERLGGHLRWRQLRELEKTLQRRGVRCAQLDADKFSAQLVTQYLSVKQRQLL